MNYYPHHIGDYITATAHLTMLEDGAYRRLLDLYYSTERALPLDRRALHRLVRARTQEEQDAVDIVIAEFFDETQDGWTHSRCDEEIEKARVAAERARTNGKKGGRPPKAEPSDNPEAKQEALPGNPEETQPVIPGLAKPNPEETQGEPSDNPEAKPPIPIPIPRPINKTPLSACADLADDARPDKPDKTTDAVTEIFDYWREVMSSPRSVLDTKRKKAIERAVKDGYSVDDLKRAILGCSMTPHNMGQNDRGQKYNGIELILRSADQIERFIANAGGTSPQAGTKFTRGNAISDPVAAAIFANRPQVMTLECLPDGGYRDNNNRRYTSNGNLGAVL